MPLVTQTETPVIEVSHVSTRFGAAVVHERCQPYGAAGRSLCHRRRKRVRKVYAVAGDHRPAHAFGRKHSSLRHRSRQLEGSDGTQNHRRFGVMFQQGALFSSLTLAENVAVPLREHRDRPATDSGHRGRENRDGGVAGRTVRGKYPSELSGGMRRRAALARAIVMDPELLFLDEPTAGLDPIIAAGFDELVLQLKGLLGLTVVMVTHDLDSLWRISDRVAVLGNGAVLGIGTMQELSRSNDPLIREYFHGPRGRAAEAQHGERPWTPKSITS